MEVLLNEETKARLAAKMKEMEENPETGDNEDLPEIVEIDTSELSVEDILCLHGFGDVVINNDSDDLKKF